MSDLNDRQRQIMEQLRASGQQSINELAAEFGVATQTIRRDINDLCDQGLARRVLRDVQRLDPEGRWGERAGRLLQ